MNVAVAVGIWLSLDSTAGSSEGGNCSEVNLPRTSFRGRSEPCGSAPIRLHALWYFSGMFALSFFFCVSRYQGACASRARQVRARREGCERRNIIKLALLTRNINVEDRYNVVTAATDTKEGKSGSVQEQEWREPNSNFSSAGREVTYVASAQGESIGNYGSSFENSVADDICSVCLEPYQQGENVSMPRYQQCRHIFHSDCIISWLVKHNDCPCCRTTIVNNENTKKVDSVWTRSIISVYHLTHLPL